MAERIIRQARPTKSVAPQAQISIDPSAPASQASSLFDTLAGAAHDSADKSAARVAEEKAASDLANNPGGVPIKKTGTSLSAQIYNRTATSIYGIQNDSEINQHMAGLEVQFEGDPAGYREASDAFLGSRINQMATFDQGLAVKTKAKFDLLQTITIPKLQEQAEKKLSEQQRDAIDLQTTTTGFTIESQVWGMFDPEHSAEVVPLIGMQISDLTSTMAGAIDPATGERRFSDEDVLSKTRELWENATYEGLVSRMPKLTDAELNDWQDKMSEDSFQTLFFTPESGAVTVPLNQMLPSATRRGLLANIGREISRREAENTTKVVGQRMAYDRHIEDLDAEARANGAGGVVYPPIEQALSVGITETTYGNGLKRFEQAQTKFFIDDFVAKAVPGVSESNLEELNETLRGGGAQSAEIEFARDSMLSATEHKRQMLSGGGNGAQYIVDAFPEIADAHDEMLKGNLDRETLNKSFENYYIQQEVAPTRRKYLTDADLSVLDNSFEAASSFVPDGQDEVGAYGEAVGFWVDAFSEEFGEFTNPAANQLAQEGKFNSDYLAMQYLDANNPEARQEFSRALTAKLDLKERFTAAETNDTKELIRNSEKVQGLIASFPQGKTGVLGFQNNLEDAMVLQAQYHMSQGSTEKEAVALAEEAFLGAVTIIEAPNQSNVRLPKNLQITPGQFRRGLTQLPAALDTLDIVTPLLVKEGQDPAQVDEIYREELFRGGQWRSDDEDKFVQFFEPNGTPVQIKGSDGQPQPLKIPMEVVAEIGKVGLGRVPSGGPGAGFFKQQLEKEDAARTQKLVAEYLQSVEGDTR